MIGPPRPVTKSCVDGHTFVDDLPRRVALLPGEVELVAQHLLDALDALLAGRPPPVPTTTLPDCLD